MHQLMETEVARPGIGGKNHRNVTLIMLSMRTALTGFHILLCDPTGNIFLESEVARLLARLNLVDSRRVICTYEV